MLRSFAVLSAVSLCACLAVVPSSALAQRVSDVSGGRAVAPSSALLPAAPLVSAPALPDGQIGIAAVVNDEAISTADLAARMRFVLVTSGLPDTAETRSKVMAQVIRTLIDEKLQMQEASRLGITIPDAQVRETMNKIAADNGVPGGDMASFLTQQGVSAKTMMDQVRSGLAWGQVVAQRLRPTIDVSEEDVADVVQRMTANVGKTEYLLGEIVIPVESPAEDEATRQLLQRLADQLQAGTPFSALARQFSKGAGAQQGGDLGWVQPGTLAPELDQVLTQMSKGSLSAPIRLLDGYHLLLVRDQRTISLGNPEDATLTIKRLSFATGPILGGDAAMAEAGRMRQKVKGCEGLEALAAESGPWVVQDLGTMRVADMKPALSALVGSLSAGDASVPAMRDGAVDILVVCAREIPNSTTPDLGRIRNSIGLERLENAAKRLMRDLRRASTQDVRV
jgi:peptidyl-prolyl cis-trans isomerase SurA